MIPSDRQIAVVVTGQDQDYMSALEWWREHSEKEKIGVWALMNGSIDEIRSADDDILEIISRFAILGFVEVSLRYHASASERTGAG